jgi:Spy/CpxP family protein refolding chaperone
MLSGAGPNTGSTLPTHQENLDMQSIWKNLPRPASLLILALPLAIACRGPHHGMANMTEAELTERMQDVAELGLDHVDANDQQIERVDAVLAGLSPSLMRLRAEHRALGAELRTELGKETVDATRVEALRKRALDLFDRASQEGQKALIATAEILTPEQRRELTYKWEKYSQ